MAEKGFGVKEINLIGASGTPTIESPNNLNLNANNVAISTNVSIGGTLSVTGNVSVGGTLTYEDVTNIDSVGIITARDHVVVGGGLSVVGISTLSNIVKIMSGLDLQTNGTLDIIGSTSSSGLDIQSNSSVQIGQNGFPNNDYATFTNTGVNLNYNNSTKLATTNTGVNVTGAITVNGSALSIDPTTSDIQVAYELLNTSSTSNGYRISGNGVDSSTNNPDLYLIRGKKYRFINNSGGSHPFQIRVSSGGSAYSTGVTNNGASSGNIDFAPTFDSPSQLVYQCTSHGSMVGNIYISGGQYHTRSNNLCLQYTRSSSNVTSGTVIYNTEVFDVGDSNAYNTSNGEFTAPITGVYRIQYEHFATGVGRATANIEKSTDGGSSWSVIKAGMRVYAADASGANWPSVPTIYIAQLNANDKIRIVHREGTIHLNTPWNHLTIQLVQ